MPQTGNGSSRFWSLASVQCSQRPQLRCRLPSPQLAAMQRRSRAPSTHSARPSAGRTTALRPERNRRAVVNSTRDLIAAGTMRPSSFASRGAVLTTPGAGFLIFPGGTTFSSPNLLSPIGSNLLDVFFTVPNSPIPLRTRGFGAVFTDVDLAATTSLSFFDSANNSLGTFYASEFNNGMSFLGVTYTDPLEMIGRVRITLGSTSGFDAVSLDDLIFGEPSAIETTPPPQSVPEPGTLALFGLGLAGLGVARRRRATN